MLLACHDYTKHNPLALFFKLPFLLLRLLPCTCSYPTIFRQQDIKSALRAAQDGSADDWGAGWDPYM